MNWSSALSRKAISAAVEGAFCRPQIVKSKIDLSRVVTLDFETYYDDDYTLKKLSTSEYVRDPRFKAHMMGIKIGRRKRKIVPHSKIKSTLAEIDWSTHDLLCHNTAFDGFILSHHYGVIPKRYFDTLSMARGLHSNDIGASLDEVAQYYGVGNKVPNVLERTKGVRELKGQLYKDSAEYCGVDVDLCLDIFLMMLEQFPASEIDLVDMTIRMFCDPVLKVDIPRVQKELEREIKYREDLMLGIVDVTQYPEKELLKTKAERELQGKERTMLMVKRIIGSNERFAALLRAEGATPPQKISPAWIKKKPEDRKDEDKWVYAFAKDDQAFIELPDRIEEWSTDLNLNRKKDIEILAKRQERLRNLVDCRLAVKSTTNITRAERFLKAGADGMPLPVGLSYARAHCLTGDAEVLTPMGWVRLDSWAGNAPIMQWYQDGVLEFTKATPNEFEIDEDMVAVNSRYHQAFYTLGHRVPDVNRRFKVIQAGDLLSQRIDLPITGNHNGTSDITALDAQLAVMVQGDGSVSQESRRGRSVRFGFRKQRKIKRCKVLLNEARVPFTESTDSEGSTRIYVCAEYMESLVAYVDGPEKKFSAALLQAPLEAKQAFIDELSHWDSSIEPHDKGFTYNTTNEYNANFVHTMAHLCGHSAFISRRDRRPDGWNDSFHVYIRRNTWTRCLPKHCSTFRHKGKVYCPTVPTGFFLMRQNGHIVITGNTLRWGGNNKMNMQNLTRGGELRQSILAPDGHVVCVADSGQIEARVNAWLWGQDDLLEAFKVADAYEHAQAKIPEDKRAMPTGDSRDAYCRFADSIYGFEVTKANKMERFVGKVCVLGLGFQMGAPKLQATLAKGALGGPPVFFELDMCQKIVQTYRRKNFRIAAGWKMCQQIIEDMAAGRTGSWKCLSWEKEKIWLPNGMCLKYPNLKKSINEDKGWDEWSYQSKDSRKKLYGGLLCENIVQCLARLIVAEQMLMIGAKYRVVLMTHDEVVTIALKKSASTCLNFMLKAMKNPPAWCPDIPLNAEGGYAVNYSK